jgi:hypothetical protein
VQPDPRFKVHAHREKTLGRRSEAEKLALRLRRLGRVVRESQVEAAFVRRVKSLGGQALKFVSPGRRGVPDRLVLWPGGRAEFVELKAPGKKATLQQMREHERLRRLGFKVTVLDCLAAVNLYGP